MSNLADKVREFGLLGCDGCGSCACICPMRELYPVFKRALAPRSTIARLRLVRNAPPAGVLADEGLWACLACEACLNACPQGVRFRDFVESVRADALALGPGTAFVSCAVCGRPYLPRPLAGALERRFREKGCAEAASVCPRCRRRAFAATLLDAFGSPQPRRPLQAPSACSRARENLLA